MVIESQSPDLIIFHKTLGLPWWFLHLDVKRLTGKLNPLAKEFWRMPELNIPFMKATMGQKLISNGSRSEISSKVCSFRLVLPCYQHNICRRIECLEKLLPWDLYSLFSAFTKKPQLFFWKVSVQAGQIFDNSMQMLLKISAGVTGSYCLIKESYYGRKPEHISRDLQTEGMHRVNWQSNRTGQHVLIVLSDSPHHDFAHSGSRTIVEFENVVFPSWTGQKEIIQRYIETFVSCDSSG